MTNHQILEIAENGKIVKSPKYRSVHSKYVLHRDKPLVSPSPNPQATPRVIKSAKKGNPDSFILSLLWQFTYSL